MSITDLTLVRAIREKLKFHEERQRVLADNVANASTPGYRGRDVKAPDFFRMAAEVRDGGGVVQTATAAGHIQAAPIDGSAARSARQAGYEVTPDGNAVVLEEQMMKVSENQMDYQVAASLYQRGLGLLRTAVGKR